MRRREYGKLLLDDVIHKYERKENELLVTGQCVTVFTFLSLNEIKMYLQIITRCSSNIVSMFANILCYNKFKTYMASSAEFLPMLWETELLKIAESTFK